MVPLLADWRDAAVNDDSAAVAVTLTGNSARQRRTGERWSGVCPKITVGEGCLSV